MNNAEQYLSCQTYTASLPLTLGDAYRSAVESFPARNGRRANSMVGSPRTKNDLRKSGSAKGGAHRATATRRDHRWLSVVVVPVNPSFALGARAFRPSHMGRMIAAHRRPRTP
jgi:hypothetical protein